jgi:hypothetical protein
VDPLNKRVDELDKWLRDTIAAFRERAAALRRQGLHIPRVYSNIDDSDLDDAPDAFVGARLRPTRPLGSSAIELPEPDEDLYVEALAVAVRR